MNEQPPPGHWPICLAGQRWQIAWALGESGLIKGVTLKVLASRLTAGWFWGRSGCGQTEVYVAKRTFHQEERVQAALTRLEEIKSRGPWHHPSHQLPKKFHNHDERYLEHRDQAVLAEVVHSARIATATKTLAHSDLATLHKVMEAGGLLYGVYDDGNHLLYLHDEVPDEAVAGAHQLLLERSAAADSP